MHRSSSWLTIWFVRVKGADNRLGTSKMLLHTPDFKKWLVTVLTFEFKAFKQRELRDVVKMHVLKYLRFFFLFYISIENVYQKFVWKTFHTIDRAKINKLSQKKQYLTAVWEKYLIKTFKYSTFSWKKWVKPAVFLGFFLVNHFLLNNFLVDFNTLIEGDVLIEFRNLHQQKWNTVNSVILISFPIALAPSVFFFHSLVVTVNLHEFKFRF